MRRRYLSAALFLWLYACAGRAPAPEAYGQTPGELVFWSIHGENGERLGYLLGAIHLDTLAAAGFDSAIESALEASDSLVVELSPSALTRDEVERVLADGVARWDEGLSAEALAEVSTAADANKLDLLRLDGAPPWLARLSLSSAIFEHAGFSSDRGYEWHFIRRAAQLELPVLELETAGEQLAALSAGTAAQQRAALVELAAEHRTLAEELRALHAAYRAGELDALDALLHPPPDSDVEALMQEAFFERRDPRLAERSAQLLAEPGCDFIILGVGHLVGPANVRQRLAQHGFTLKRVPAAGLSEVERLPVAIHPPPAETALPVANIDFPPDLEQRTDDMAGNRSMQLIADVAGFRYVYTISALGRAMFLERLFGNIEHGVTTAGPFRKVMAEDAEVGGVSGRLHRFESETNTFLGAIAYRDGFVHTFAVIGPSNRAVELEERFDELRASFSVE